MVDREPSMADADIAAENGDENSRRGQGQGPACLGTTLFGRSG